jgi:CubicO group peptidase (beta-lactamase class C family)
MKYLDLYNLRSFGHVKRATAILLFLMTLIMLKTEVSAQETPAGKAAEQRAQAYINALNSNKRAEWSKFIGESFAKSALERVPVEARLGNFSRIYDETRGVSFQSVRWNKPNEVFVHVKSNLTGQDLELVVQVEEQTPFYIALTGLRPQLAQNKTFSDREITEELEAHLRKLAGADVFSGAVLLARGERVLYEKAFGEANKDFKALNNVNTKFNLGSMNKMFTAVAIAQLVEAGKLSFDDPLGKFMPDFPDKEAAEKIKIKHLLTHTSGLGSYFNREFFGASRARFRTVDEFLELAKGEKMAFEPGTKSQYSNTGFLVLGKIIEKASGQNYFDYVRENIYKKAGMTNSDSYDLDNVNPNLAVGYEKEYTEQGIVFRNNVFQHVIKGGPAGGGYSTIGDLLKFANALRGGRLVGAEYVKILTSPKPELGSPTYGYGFVVSKNPDMTGHSGGFLGINSELMIFTGSGYTAVVLSNYGGGAQSVGGKIRALVGACADCGTAKK